jgi:hypothetical protein
MIDAAMEDRLLQRLRDRDGEMVWSRRLLTRREADLEGLPPPGAFAARTPEQQAVADFVVYANHEENAAAEMFYARAIFDNEVSRYHLLEELYHSRIFHACGLALGARAKPARIPAMRALSYKAMATLPRDLTAPLFFSGEVLGMLIVSEIRRLVVRHFPEARAVAAAIDEVITDEIGHTQYYWMRMGAPARGATRRIAGAVLSRAISDLPAIDAEFNPGRLRERCASFRPEQFPDHLSARIWGDPAAALPTW